MDVFIYEYQNKKKKKVVEQNNKTFLLSLRYYAYKASYKCVNKSLSDRIIRRETGKYVVRKKPKEDLVQHPYLLNYSYSSSRTKIAHVRKRNTDHLNDSGLWVRPLITSYLWQIIMRKPDTVPWQLKCTSWDRNRYLSSRDPAV